MSHAKISRPPSYFTRRESACGFPSLFLFFSSRFPVLHGDTHRNSSVRCSFFFFFISLGNTAFRLRDIDSRYLIPFGTTLRCSWKRLDNAIDWTSAVVGTAIVQKSRFSRSDAICVLVCTADARRLLPFPNGKNIAAHDTSLDRYPVWRIRSFIGIDMFSSSLVVYFRSWPGRKTHFDPLGIIIRLYFELDRFLARILNLINVNCKKIFSRILRFTGKGEKMVGMRNKSDFSNTHVQNNCSRQSIR